VADILQVADRVRSSPDALPDAMVLGTRSFSGEVPLRSRLGNSASRVLFRLATGESLRDTQTGLRAYPGSMLGWLQSISGERYEYELNLLLRAADAGIAIDTVQIQTIYLRDNESSHFRPVADSVPIYAPLLTFALSSMVAFVIDMTALLVLNALTGSLLLAVVGARIISSWGNFLTNRRLVFEHGRDKPRRTAAAQYFALVVGLLTINYLSLLALQVMGCPLLPAKLLTELALFVVSYGVQRRLVFARVAGRPGTEPARRAVGGGILSAGQRERLGG
jgi:putative flippase GtrA